MSVFSWASNLLDSVDSSAQETIQQQLNKAKPNRAPLRDSHSSSTESSVSANSSSSVVPPSSTAANVTSSSSAASSTLTAPPVSSVLSSVDKSPKRNKRIVQQLPSTPPTKPASFNSPPAITSDEAATHHSLGAELTNGVATGDAATSFASAPVSPSPTLDPTTELNGSAIRAQHIEFDPHSNAHDGNDSSLPAPSTATADNHADTSVATFAAPPSDAAAQSAESVSGNVFTEEALSAQTRLTTHATATPAIAPPSKGKMASAASSILPTASAFFSSAIASAASSSTASAVTASSTTMPSTISSSSSSSDAAAEIASLRNVWNETREQLAKAKKLLSLKEESHSKALQQLSHDWQTAMDAQQAEYEEKAKRLQEAMDRQTAEFQQAMATRKEYAKELTAKEAEHEGTIEQLQQRLQAMEEKQQQLMDEREQMMNMHSAALSSHQSLLARLRAEEAERMVTLEAEMKAKTSSFAYRQDRDTSQEEEQIQYTQIAAQVQRELEDKTRQLDRVMAEKRWIEADQQSLNDQLTTMKTRVDEQHKQVSHQHSIQFATEAACYVWCADRVMLTRTWSLCRVSFCSCKLCNHHLASAPRLTPPNSPHSNTNSRLNNNSCTLSNNTTQHSKNSCMKPHPLPPPPQPLVLTASGRTAFVR